MSETEVFKTLMREGSKDIPTGVLAPGVSCPDGAHTFDAKTKTGCAHTRRVGPLSTMTRLTLILSALARKLTGTALLVFLDLVLHAQEEDLAAPFPRPYATIGDMIGSVRSDATRADDEAIGKAATELEAAGLVERCDRLELYGRLGPGTPYFWTLVCPSSALAFPAWGLWQDAIQLAASFAPFLDRNATAAYLRLLPHLDADGQAAFTASGLGRALGMHRDTARRCLQKLEDTGLLVWYPSAPDAPFAVWLSVPANVTVPERDTATSDGARELAKRAAAEARQRALSRSFDRAEGEHLLRQVWGPHDQIIATVRLLGRGRGKPYSQQEVVELVLRPLIQLQHRYGQGLGLLALRQARTAALHKLANGGTITNYYGYLDSIVDAKLHQFGARTKVCGDS